MLLHIFTWEFSKANCILGCQQLLNRSHCLRLSLTVPAWDHPLHQQCCKAASCSSPDCLSEESNLGQRHQLSEKMLVLHAFELSAKPSPFSLKEAHPMIHPWVWEDWRSLASVGVWRDEPVLAAVCRCLHQARLLSRQISTCFY